MARRQKPASARSKPGQRAGSGRAKASTRKPAAASLEERAVDAALELAAERGWGAVSLTDIAERAGASIADLHAVLPSKGAILDAFARRIDRATLAGVEIDAKDAGTVRDRLFD